MSTSNPAAVAEATVAADDNQFWRDAGRALVAGSISTCDEVAKQLVTVTALLEGLYFHAITFSELRDPSKYARATLLSWWWLYLLPIALLLISLACALLVFFPQRYQVNIGSSIGSKVVFEAIAARKLRFVQLAAGFLVAGIAATLAAAWAYLAH